MDPAVPHRVLTLDDWEELEPEPLGARGGHWFRSPESDEPWLFKPVRPRKVPTPDGTTHFEEDWAEKIGTEIGRLLSVPVADVELASWTNKRGVASRSFVRDPARPQAHGNELLHELDFSYGKSLQGEVPGYTLDAIQAALAPYAPPACELPLETAWDAFAGYLLLDALIANTDRHHENWAVVPHDDVVRLAPSYDHGTCLGFQLTDSQRTQRLTTSDRNYTVHAWASKGRSRPFEGKPHLVELALEALRRSGPAAREYWRERLEQLDTGAVAEAVERVPPRLMSQPARTFVATLVRVNRERLLEQLT